MAANLPTIEFSNSEFRTDTQNTITVKVKCSGTVINQATVDYQTEDGSAIAGTDYTPMHGTLTYQPGDTEKSITVKVSNSGQSGVPGYAKIRLSNPSGATLGTKQASRLITSAASQASKLLGRTFILRGILIGGSLLLLAVLLIFGLIGETSILKDIANIDYARGLITFLISSITVLIAFILVISLVLGVPDTGDMFAHGKEILAILIGVLGTIVGFYYGASTNQKPKLQLSPIVTVPKEIQFGKDVDVAASVTGGTQPYQYSIHLDSVNPVNGTSKDGHIEEKITLPSKSTEETTTLEITVTDKDGATVNTKEDVKIIKEEVKTNQTPPGQTTNANSSR